ncbi:MAG: chorismate-binding protein [Chitinophagales bacterium]
MNSNFSNSEGIIAYSPFNSTEFQFYTSKKVSQNSSNLFMPSESTKKFVFAAFNNSHLPNLVFEDLHKINIDSAKSIFESALSFPNETNFKDYKIQFEAAQKLLNTDLLQKVILSRIIHFSIKDLDINPIAYFKSICRKYPQSFNYLCYHPTCGLWIGATPETLLEIKGNQLNSMSLAGTRPKEEHPPKWRTKEIEEQTIVTKYIRNVLKSHFSGELKESKVENLFTGSVWHLITRFEQELESGDFSKLKDFIADIHPTPAISGLPKTAALNAIEKIEKHDRQYYTGFLGLVEAENVHLFVNLRCLRWQEDKVAFFVGGGITKDSKLLEEWEETTNKSQTLLQLFNKM